MAKVPSSIAGLFSAGALQHNFYNDMSFGKNGEIISKGPAWKIFMTLSTFLRINYSIAIPYEKTTGNLRDDGNWTGSLAALQLNEADFSTGPFFPTYERGTTFAPTTCFWWDELRILGGEQLHEAINVSGYVLIFDWITWLLIGLCLMAIAIISCWYHYRLLDQTYHLVCPTSWKELLSDYLYYYFQNLLGEANERHQMPQQWVIRLMHGPWWLGAFLLVSCFSASMRASLMIQSGPPRIETGSDVISRRHLVPYLWRGSVYPRFLQHSDDEYQRQIYKRAERLNSILYSQDLWTDNPLRKVLKGEAIILSELSSLKSGVTQHCEVRLEVAGGRFYVNQHPFLVHPICMLMRPQLSDAIKRRINTKLLEMFESGVIAHYYRRSLGEFERCSGMENRKTSAIDTEWRPLRVNDVSLILIILVLFTAFSFLVLLTEIAIHHRNISNFKKRKNINQDVNSKIIRKKNRKNQHYKEHDNFSKCNTKNGNNKIKKTQSGDDAYFCDESGQQWINGFKIQYFENMILPISIKRLYISRQSKQF